jgi:hypothetical protein
MAEDAIRAAVYGMESYRKQAEQQTDHDPVSPAHYRGSNGVECIAAQRACMTPPEFRGYLRGMCIKYLWRLNSKDTALVNARKAQKILGWLVDELAREGA